MRRNRVGYLIGIDEAGRGPLAGPVSVGVLVLPQSFDRRLLRGVRSSKLLSPRARDEWYEKTRMWQRQEKLSYAVSLVGERYIDRCGIVAAVREGIRRCLARLELEPLECKVLLDGSLKAPSEFKYQKTIIRGDETEAVISLASVMAKVWRDRRMTKLSLRHPSYQFEAHKGYGTKDHYRKIKRYGMCDLHRRSFVHS